MRRVVWFRFQVTSVNGFEVEVNTSHRLTRNTETSKQK